MTPHPGTPPESPRSPPRNLLAVVGTDTGVGKTVVAAGLIHGLRLAGLKVAAFKPVETGLVNGRLPGGLADWQRLAAVSDQDPDSCLGQSFALPAAPLAAAREAGREICLSDLTEQLQALGDHRDLVVVEGAGGLCVPFARDRAVVPRVPGGGPPGSGHSEPHAPDPGPSASQGNSGGWSDPQHSGHTGRGNTPNIWFN